MAAVLAEIPVSKSSHFNLGAALNRAPNAKRIAFFNELLVLFDPEGRRHAEMRAYLKDTPEWHSRPYVAVLQFKQFGVSNNAIDKAARKHLRH